MMQFQKIASDVKLGKDVQLFEFINLYGCEIGDETKVGAFVEIQKDVVVGKRCKIGTHTFICEGVTIEDEVFIGHNVSFINDKYPASVTDAGKMKGSSDWNVVRTHVGFRAAIGTSATILCGVKIGANSIIGAGSVVTKDVPEGTIVAGNPARYVKHKIK